MYVFQSRSNPVVVLIKLVLYGFLILVLVACSPDNMSSQLRLEIIQDLPADINIASMIFNDSSNTLFVGDTSNGQIHIIDMLTRRVDSIDSPAPIAMAATTQTNNNLFVVDNSNSRIAVFDFVTRQTKTPILLQNETANSIAVVNNTLYVGLKNINDARIRAYDISQSPIIEIANLPATNHSIIVGSSDAYDIICSAKNDSNLPQVNCWDVSQPGISSKLSSQTQNLFGVINSEKPGQIIFSQNTLLNNNPKLYVVTQGSAAAGGTIPSYGIVDQSIVAESISLQLDQAPIALAFNNGGDLAIVAEYIDETNPPDVSANAKKINLRFYNTNDYSKISEESTKSITFPKSLYVQPNGLLVTSNYEVIVLLGKNSIANVIAILQ